MIRPLVSVVIPSYNRGDLLLRSVASVQKQSFKDIEIIVVDDGSTDNTLELLEGIAEERLKVLRHTENKGANAARNTGIEASKGKYIAFQDSDDVWHEKKLEMQVADIQSANVSVSFCAFNRISNQRAQIIPKHSLKLNPGKQDLLPKLLRASFISNQTLLVEREALIDAGCFDENIPRLQDWELCIRLAGKYEFSFLNEALVDVHIQDDSISNQATKYYQAIRAIIAKHQDLFESDAVARPIQLLNASALAASTGDFAQCLSLFKLALSFGVWNTLRAALVLLQRW